MQIPKIENRRQADTTQVRLPLRREIQVSAETARKPKVVARLSDWEYLERSVHRLLTGWTRYIAEWDDKVACHRHIWEQSECVRRLRERLVQFPGSSHNLDGPVSEKLEKLVDTVLIAPTHQDAVDGIYQLLCGALSASYLDYVQSAHPVHDAPTVAMLSEIVTLKEGLRLWLREYRRRYPHTIDHDYRKAIEAALRDCDFLKKALPLDGTASPAGVNTDFRLPYQVALPSGTEPDPNIDIWPYLVADFATDIEARRLFWCYGYLLEMNLAMEQLRWIYDSPQMPWQFHQDLSRHLWDESRHGDSGHSRLLDFGITIQEIGFRLEGDAQKAQAAPPAATQYQKPEVAPAIGLAAPLTSQQLYDAVFFTGMIAETTNFNVKRESYEDFRDGGDLESAEMMLFDIIDEATHVQYAHRWLPLLAEKAGIAEDYKARSATIRHEKQEALFRRLETLQDLPRTLDNPSYAFYQHLLGKMREKLPLTNALTCPPRSPRPA